MSDKPQTLKLGKSELAEAVPDEKSLVPARFEGSADPTEQAGLLEHEGHRLPLGQIVRVPQHVFDLLTSGDNARLYRVVKPSKDELAEAEAQEEAATGDESPPAGDSGASA